MAKYTNKHGLPPLLARVLERDSYYLKADYSATGLIRPPQIGALSKRYADKIVIDVAEEIWSLIGRSTHAIIEKTPGADILQEEQLVLRVEVDSVVYTVQMTPDLYQIGMRHLWDYKVTSVWSAMKLKPEWEQQANIYRAGLHDNGYQVDRINILAILRDWSINQARIERQRGNYDYPSVQVKVLPVPIWSLTKTYDFIVERIRLHEKARSLTDAELAAYMPCSEKERWAKTTTYPVIREMKGGPRAASGTAKFTEVKQGLDFIHEKGKLGDKVVKRLGEQKRCEMYCNAAPFCQQFKQMKESDGEVIYDNVGEAA